jgi:acetyl/propionyl-CoA carboxylase alpha subunit
LTVCAALARIRSRRHQNDFPFFQEIVEDKEFIAGNLDTGFIGRFNERKKAQETDETTRDLAMIASVLAQSEKQQAAPKATEQTVSRWALAGRSAAHQNRI